MDNRPAFMISPNIYSASIGLTGFGQPAGYSPLAPSNHHETNWSIPLNSNARQTIDEKTKRLLEVHEAKLNGVAGFSRRWQEYFDYSPQGYVLANSDFPGKKDFPYCGLRHECGLTYSCEIRTLCPRCAYNRLAHRALETLELAPTHAYDHWWVTLSLSTDLEERNRLHVVDDRSETGDENLENPPVSIGTLPKIRSLRAVWWLLRMYDELIFEFSQPTKLRFIAGAIGGREITVRFRPLQFNPHAHFVIATNGQINQHLRNLRNAAKWKIDNSRFFRPEKLQIGPLYPNLHARRLYSNEDAQICLRYKAKAVQIGQPYIDATWRVGDDATSLSMLNHEVDEALEIIYAAYYRQKPMRAYGVFSKNHEQNVQLYEYSLVGRRRNRSHRDTQLKDEWTKLQAHLSKRKQRVVETSSYVYWWRRCEWLSRQLNVDAETVIGVDAGGRRAAPERSGGNCDDNDPLADLRSDPANQT